MMSQFLLATAILVASATVYVGKEWRSAFASAFGVTILYLRALVFFLRGGTYKACPYFTTERNSAGLSTERERLQAKAQTYSLALIFYLWSKPHYRSGTFANDMVKVRSRRVGGERTNEAASRLFAALTSTPYARLPSPHRTSATSRSPAPASRCPSSPASSRSPFSSLFSACR